MVWITEIFTQFAIINEKLIVNQVHQRDEKEKSGKQNCFKISIYL